GSFNNKLPLRSNLLRLLVDELGLEPGKDMCFIRLSKIVDRIAVDDPRKVYEVLTTLAAEGVITFSAIGSRSVLVLDWRGKSSVQSKRNAIARDMLQLINGMRDKVLRDLGDLSRRAGCEKRTETLRIEEAFAKRAVQCYLQSLNRRGALNDTDKDFIQIHTQILMGISRPSTPYYQHASLSLTQMDANVTLENKHWGSLMGLASIQTRKLSLWTKSSEGGFQREELSLSLCILLPFFPLLPDDPTPDLTTTTLIPVLRSLFDYNNAALLSNGTKSEPFNNVQRGLLQGTVLAPPPFQHIHQRPPPIPQTPLQTPSNSTTCTSTASFSPTTLPSWPTPQATPKPSSTVANNGPAKQAPPFV
ncbi:hypothetical protein HDV05_008709, partial [Chytridiales sp. JEL 0842]